MSDAMVLDKDEVGEAPLGRRLAAEFMGTLLFVAIGTGAATVFLLGPLRALSSSLDVLRTIPNFDQAENIKLFGEVIAGGPGDILPVAFAFAAALAAIVYAIGGVSGAHVNPAVTFALAVSRRFRWSEVPLYWIAQCAGAIGGAFLIRAIYGPDGAIFEGTEILYGATRVARGITMYQGILAEAFIAFILMTAVMAVAIDPRAPRGWSGLIIGFSLAAGILVTADATGGSANFARSLGPFVASLATDAKNIPWSDLITYAAGPIIGATAAALVYESVTGLEQVAPAPRPGAATPPAISGDEPFDVISAPPPPEA